MKRVGSRAAAGLAALVVSVSLLGTSPTPATAIRDRDCSDFSTWRQAQKFFKRHGGTRRHDPHRLDADHDGIACEELLN
jgi:hypothetical protein